MKRDTIDARMLAPGLIALGLVCAIFLCCTPSQRSTMTGAFATCAEGDLGALVSPGVRIIDDVSAIIKDNTATLEADLTGLATTFGLAIVECAIAAVEAVLLAPAPGIGSGSAATPSTNASTPPPGLVRALAWSAQQSAQQNKVKP